MNRTRHVRMDAYHARLAKTIANLRGLSIKDYLGQKVMEDSEKIPSDIAVCQQIFGFPKNPPKRRLYE